MSSLDTDLPRGRIRTVQKLRIDNAPTENLETLYSSYLCLCQKVVRGGGEGGGSWGRQAGFYIDLYKNVT